MKTRKRVLIAATVGIGILIVLKLRTPTRDPDGDASQSLEQEMIEAAAIRKQEMKKADELRRQEKKKADELRRQEKKKADELRRQEKKKADELRKQETEEIVPVVVDQEDAGPVVVDQEDAGPSRPDGYGTIPDYYVVRYATDGAIPESIYDLLTERQIELYKDTKRSAAKARDEVTPEQREAARAAAEAAYYDIRGKWRDNPNYFDDPFN
jgi:hypothetical protein